MTDKEEFGLVELIDLVREWARLEHALGELMEEWTKLNAQQRVIKDKLLKAIAEEMR